MLRVLTLNLWNNSGPWKLRREEIVRWFRQLDADIVCVQEVLGETTGDRNTARWVAERTGYGHVALGMVRPDPACCSATPS